MTSRTLRNIYNKDRTITKDNWLRNNLLELHDLSQAEVIIILEDMDTLDETQRRQNITCSLVNISDGMFNFFLYLDGVRRQETVEAYHVMGPTIIQDITNELLLDCGSLWGIGVSCTQMLMTASKI